MSSPRACPVCWLIGAHRPGFTCGDLEVTFTDRQGRVQSASFSFSEHGEVGAFQRARDWLDQEQRRLPCDRASTTWLGRKLRWAWCALRGHPGYQCVAGYAIHCARCSAEGE